MCGILGSTYNGAFEDIEGMDRMLEELNKRTGWNVPLHVDAASGGFIAPFIYPDLKWDFRLKNVVSINVSGHKCGARLSLPFVSCISHSLGAAVWLSNLTRHPVSTCDYPMQFLFRLWVACSAWCYRHAPA